MGGFCTNLHKHLFGYKARGTSVRRAAKTFVKIRDGMSVKTIAKIRDGMHVKTIAKMRDDMAAKRLDKSRVKIVAKTIVETQYSKSIIDIEQ